MKCRMDNDTGFEVSAIMTVKNGAKFIEQSLMSMINQTHAPTEIIIVDDGSTDDTRRVVEEIKQRCDLIRYIGTPGVGRAKALNIAVKEAKCNWVANLDVDDCWAPAKLACQLDVLKKNPNASMVITKSKIFFDDSFVVFGPQNYSELNTCQLVDKSAFYSRNPVNHSSVLLSKKVLLRVSGYDESLSAQIDYSLWVRIVSKGCKVYLINEQLAAKRLHPNQSFESNKRFYYLLHALKMNYLGLQKLNAPILFYFRPLISFMFGLFPRKYRSFVKNTVLSTKSR